MSFGYINIQYGFPLWCLGFCLWMNGWFVSEQIDHTKPQFHLPRQLRQSRLQQLRRLDLRYEAIMTSAVTTSVALANGFCVPTPAWSDPVHNTQQWCYYENAM